MFLLFTLLNIVLVVQVCDATNDDRNTAVWYKIIRIKKADVNTPASDF